MQLNQENKGDEKWDQGERQEKDTPIKYTCCLRLTMLAVLLC